MFREETTLLELRADSAVVSTEGLMRLLELPTGRIAGELLNIHEGSADYTSYGERPNDDAPWLVAVDYSLLHMLAEQGVDLMSLVVEPTPQTRCCRCGSEVVKDNRR